MARLADAERPSDSRTVACALLYAAIGQQHGHSVWSMLAGVLALVALRGCPACWTLGLVETIQQRLRR